MKIALVKQDVYQDLYVCPSMVSPEKMLESTIMRTGPLGLFTLYNSDFLIVHEASERECKTYRKSYRPPKDVLRQLPGTPIDQIKGETFDYLAPRSHQAHSDFAVSVDSVNWGIYDIVISINIAIPERIVKCYPDVLWCYMIGEAGRQTRYVEFGYDVRLTQEVTGAVADSLGPVDFPYTFIGPECLERIAGIYGAGGVKTGVYAEINMTRERPVRSVPQLEFVRKLGHDVVVHDQDIIDNLIRLKNSKYFVKLGGRKIRGNSVIEAISAGTLVLMDPKDLVHSQLLPKECWIHSEQELRNAIVSLDRDNDRYVELLTEQRKRLASFVVDAPMESLSNCLHEKRSGKHPCKRNALGVLREIRRNYF